MENATEVTLTRIWDFCKTNDSGLVVLPRLRYLMELLLNLAWLLLALPASWLWRDRTNSAVLRKSSPLHFLLALGCMLVPLFPVISATDDLSVMRAEFEESPAGKHSIRQSNNGRLYVSKGETQPSVASTSSLPLPGEQGWLSTLELHPSAVAAHADLRPSRTPPNLVLG